MIAIIVIAVIVLILVGLYFYYNNLEIRLRNEAEAQRGKIESVFDKMWKVIKQKAEVAEQYREAFEEIYPKLIEGRYGTGQDGSLMKWIQEHNPDFDTSLYLSLSQSIETLRAEFSKYQERMLDIIREHKSLLQTLPAKWFLGNRPPIEYEVISSTRTKQVMEDAIDDNVKVFED